MAYIKNNILMGSGDLFALPVEDIADVFNLTEAEEAKLVNLGYIEANASLKAASEKVEIKAANAGVVGGFDKDKKVTFQTGIFSFNLENISKFLTGSEFVENEDTGKQTFTYSNTDKSPGVYLRFVAIDEGSKKKVIYNMFSCEFAGELSFEMGNEKQVVFDYNFKVLAKRNPTSGKYQYFQVVLEDIE